MKKLPTLYNSKQKQFFQILENFQNFSVSHTDTDNLWFLSTGVSVEISYCLSCLLPLIIPFRARLQINNCSAIIFSSLYP